MDHVKKCEKIALWCAGLCCWCLPGIAGLVWWRYPGNHGTSLWFLALIPLLQLAVSVVLLLSRYLSLREMARWFVPAGLVLATLALLDGFNVAVDYEVWLKRGMPVWGEFQVTGRE